MEKEISMIEKELLEIKYFDTTLNQEDVVSFSEYCSAFLTIICC